MSTKKHSGEFALIDIEPTDLVAPNGKELDHTTEGDLTEQTAY